MFSPYNNAITGDEHREIQKLNQSDLEIYEDTLKQLETYRQQYIDSDGKHCDYSLIDALFKLEDITTELAYTKSLFDQECSRSERLKESKILTFLTLASLSSAYFIAIEPSFDLCRIIFIVLACAFSSCAFLFLAYGITDMLYHYHPDFDLGDSSDQKVLVVILALPVIIAVVYKVIQFIAC